MPPSNSVFSDALISLALKLGGSGLLFIVSILISRTLGAAEFGMFSLYMSLLLPFSMLARLGLENNLMRLIAKSDIPAPYARTLFGRTLIVVLPVSLGISLILFVIGSFLPDHGTAANFQATLPWLALGLPFHAVLFIAIFYFRGRHRIFLSMVFENILLYAVLLIWLLFIGLNEDNASVPAGLALSLVITFLASLFFFSHRDESVPESNILAPPALSERLRESFPMLTTSLSTIAFVTVDVFLLSLFLEPAEVGIYAAAAKLVAFVSFPLMAIIGMIAPRFSRLDTEASRAALRDVFRQSTGFAFWSGMPVVLIIALFPEQLLGLFGAGFEQATDIVFILLLGHFVTILLGPIGYLLWMTGHAGALQRVTLSSLIVTILLCLTMIPLLGTPGAALAITAGLLSKSLGSWYLVIRHLNFNPLYLPMNGLFHALYRKH